MSWLWLAPVLLLNLLLVRGLLGRAGLAAAAATRACERAMRAEAALAAVGVDALLAAPDQTVLACGDGVRRLMGEPAVDTTGSSAMPAGRWAGRPLATLDPAFDAVRGSVEATDLLLDRDGRRLGCRVIPLRGPAGEPLGYLATWRDAGAERERAQRDERDRSRQQRESAALEGLDLSLMIVDAELRIARMNAAMHATLAPLGAELTARLGRTGSQELIGAPVSLFDTDAWQAADLQRPDATPCAATLELGGRLLEVRATPLRAADGAWLGAVLRWQDRTDAARVEAQILQVVADVKRYNLVPRVPLEGCAGALATLGAGVNQVADTMAGIVSTVGTLARQVSDGAAVIAGENRQLGEQASRAADSLAATVHGTREMTAAIRQLTESAHLASRLAGDMRSAAVHGGEVVHGAREAMSQIERTSRRVADVVTVIDTLAFQTNLLALNAAIEAAHAGPHGGGFAVVAAEVRALAARSKEAAREVHALIDDTLRCVEAGSGRVTQSEQALNEIIGSARGVEQIVTQIDAVAAQQSDGIGRIDAAVLELQRYTRDHEALVERTARESGALAEQSADLAGLMRRYRLPEAIVNAPKLRERKRPTEAPAALSVPRARPANTARAS